MLHLIRTIRGEPFLCFSEAPPFEWSEWSLRSQISDLPKKLVLEKAKKKVATTRHKYRVNKSHGLGRYNERNFVQKNKEKIRRFGVKEGVEEQKHSEIVLDKIL